MESKIAIIAGASGLIGQSLLELLLKDERYARVIALVRRPLKIDHEKLQQLEINFDLLDTLEGFPEGDDVLLLRYYASQVQE